MKLSISWLRDLVEIDENYQPDELARRITNSIAEVEEFEVIGEDWDPALITVAEIVDIAKHPNADRLQVATIKITDSELKEVICGDPTIFVGQRVAFAREGALLVDGKTGQKTALKARPIRGVESAGMILSEKELGISDDHEAVLTLSEDAPIGAALSDVQGDVIFDLYTWANRADLLGVVGIAREIAALEGNSLLIPETGHLESDRSVSDCIDVNIQDADLCPRYTAAVIHGIQIGSSPEWLKKRLRAHGVRPINNVVDVTNYVMLETGQPLHAFDYESISDQKIVIRKAKAGESIVTIDGIERELTKDILAICDSKRPIAVAGIMGSLNSQVTQNTKSILLEVANFSPSGIRRGSMNLKLRSEASTRFEKGLGTGMADFAQARALHLFEKLCGGISAKGMLDIYPGDSNPNLIELSTERIERVLGIEISNADIVRILESLGFDITENEGGESFKVVSPYWRTDIDIADDLIEEIIRIYGYENLPTTNLAGALPDPIENPLSMLRDNSRVIVSGLGFQEILTYTLTSKEDLERVNDPNDEVRLSPLAVSNPVASQHTWLRTSLRSSLLRTFADNRKHQDQALRLFEIGVEFLPVAEDLPEERPVMCAVLGGGRLERWTRPEAENLDFFDAKGVLEALLISQGIDVRFADVDLFPLKTGFAAEAVAIKTDETVALVGQIDETVTGFFDIDEPVYLIEFWLSKAVHALNLRPEYSPPPRYPDARHDLAVIVPEDVLSGDIIDFVCAHRSGDVLCEAELFDEYRGEGLPPNMKSLGFAVRYRSKNRTLKDKDVLKCRKSLLNRLEKVYGAVLRN